MGKMKLSEIKIRENFLNTIPSPTKYQKKREKWLRTGRQDRYIVVDNNGYLEDGYITYLVMKEFKNGWGRTEYGGQEGWVKLSYLTPCKKKK